MSKYEVAVGDQFGKWTVLCETQTKTKHRRCYCQCECGVKRVVLLQNLLSGQSKSCGCVSKGSAAAAKRLYKQPIKLKGGVTKKTKTVL